MKIGDTIEYWAWKGDEGDVHEGVLLAVNGDRAVVREGAAIYGINTRLIYGEKENA